MNARLFCVLLLSILVGGCDRGEPVDSELSSSIEHDGMLYVVAGTEGVGGNGGDGGPAAESFLYWPVGLTVASGGQVVFADLNNNRVRVIGTDGTIRGFVGSGIPGDGVSGPGSSISFYHPTDIAIAPDGKYYVADYDNHKIKAFDASTLECSVPVGTPRGFAGPTSSTQLTGSPSSIVFDHDGNMYFLDHESLFSRIYKFDPQTGTLETFAGRVRGYADGFGQLAKFAFPWCASSWCGGAGIEISPDGEDLYVSDTENHVIRKISIATRIVTTIAGIPGEPGWDGDGGPALMAHLNYPTDLDVTMNGDIYVADSHNHVIRKITASGIITTVAGNATPGASANGTRAVEAMLRQPEDLAFDDATNTLYIADTYNHQIKRVRNP